jgi:hypothetical protein
MIKKVYKNNAKFQYWHLKLSSVIKNGTMIALCVLMVSFIGCGKEESSDGKTSVSVYSSDSNKAEKTVSVYSSDNKKVEEVISIYESYRNDKVSKENAMTQIYKLSTEVSDASLTEKIKNIGNSIAFENINGTSGTDLLIQDLNVYLGKISENETTTAARTSKEILKEGYLYIHDFYTSLVDLSDYLNYGTDLDAGLTIEQLLDIYKERDMYVNEIALLSDEDYKVAKSAFTKAIDEIDKYYILLSENREDIINSKATKQTLGLGTLYQYVTTVQSYAYKN